MNDRTPSAEINFRVMQLGRQHQVRIHTRLQALGLYPGQPAILSVLQEKGDCSQSELAEAIHVKPATVTRMVQRMEKAGWIVRQPDPKDQRTSRVSLTEAGRAIHTRVEVIMQEIENEMLVGFTPEERALLRRFLIQMRDNLALVNRDVEVDL